MRPRFGKIELGEKKQLRIPHTIVSFRRQKKKEKNPPEQSENQVFEVSDVSRIYIAAVGALLEMKRNRCQTNAANDRI